MGLNVSMIVIQNTDNFKDEALLIQHLGYYSKYESDTCLDECMNPDDDSVAVGYYNNCILVCADFDVINRLISDKIDFRKTSLVSLFPNSEILVLSCYDTISYHGYLFIKDQHIHRLKSLSADDGFYYNFGDMMEEEKPIYAKSIIENGNHVWKYGDGEDDYNEEQQMAQIFICAIAERLLGVCLDSEEAEELWSEVTFRKYINLEK